MSGGMCGDVCIQRGIWTVQSQSSPLPQTSIVNILVGANAVVDVAFLKRRGVSVFWGTQIEAPRAFELDLASPCAVFRKLFV